MNGLIRYTRPTELFDWSRMLDSFFDDAPVWNTQTPAVDVKEEEKRYLMEVELPGLTDKDIERMKRNLAAEFKKVFTEELQAKGGYQVVDTLAPDVLVLRPALLNVEVSAPDLMAPGISATVVRSAGQMTLYLELWDAATNTILARVMDAAADPDTMAERASRITNKAAADRLLRDWAGELRKHLDAARGKEAS